MVLELVAANQDIVFNCSAPIHTGKTILSLHIFGSLCTTLAHLAELPKKLGTHTPEQNSLLVTGLPWRHMPAAALSALAWPASGSL